MKDGFLKIASVAPEMKVADCAYNADAIIQGVLEASKRGVKLIAFPELCVTGATCQDLFWQSALQKGALDALCRIAEETAATDALFAIGLPLAFEGKLYNVAAVICHGEILALIPKTNPSLSESGDARWFHAPDPDFGAAIPLPNGQTPFFSARQLLRCRQHPLLTVAVVVGEDASLSHSLVADACGNGATVVLNLSASEEIVGRYEARQSYFSALSATLNTVFVFCTAGEYESTTDLIFSGYQLILENGEILAEARPFEGGYAVTDCDLERVQCDRVRRSSPSKNPSVLYSVEEFSLSDSETTLSREIPRFPFIPSNPQARSLRCSLITTMQATALARRLSHIGCDAVVGISGGLDSTLALLITAKAYDILKRDRKGITCITMPGFGTTSRTKSNAEKLCESLGVSFRTIPIGASVRQHFLDIGHDGTTTDVTYENAQARERTQILMDVANMSGSIVIGTGDLSELALGWATYNGDHMSMYGVNGSIPKTLVRHLVTHFANIAQDNVLRDTLLDILDTPVSPELLPPNGDGQIAQITEDLVGPYELHDFFLYFILRYGFSPAKIYRMALYAWQDVYSKETIFKWLKNFYRRFFTQQFKRSCLPDGPKIGTVGLSPRGEWKMPSDASAHLWQSELENLPQ